MTAIPVILITVAGPGGHVDVGVRSDATPAELAASLGSVIGTTAAWPGAEHRAPPRPGEPGGRRAALRPGTSLAEAGVSDGDFVVFLAPGTAPPGGDPVAAPGASWHAARAGLTRPEAVPEGGMYP
jgi:hypothetical protein